MKKSLFLLLIVIGNGAFSQDWPVKKLVEDKKGERIAFKQLPAFSFVTNKAMLRGGTYQELKLNAGFIPQIVAEGPAALQLTIPLGNNEKMTFELVKYELGNVKFTQNNMDVIENVKIPLTYRGIIAGEPTKNTVVLTINDEDVSLIASFNDKAIQITKANEKDRSSYRLYNSKKVQFPAATIDCGTIGSLAPEPVGAIQLNGVMQRPAAPQDKCINVFVDCFDSLYLWQNSDRQRTINYVYELYNTVATCFANEQISIEIAGINVWTTPDPYSGLNRDTAKADLSAYYKDNFYGNICVGLDYSSGGPRSGIASIGSVKGLAPGVCPAYSVNNSPFAYCDLNYTTIAPGANDFPVGPNTTGAAVYLVVHEMGHLLGSRHTHWCGWKLTSNPDTFGALDNCGPLEAKDAVTAVCSTVPPPPATGGTIMSYCVGNATPNDFVSFNNGFGLLPGNAIRNFVDQTLCLPTCLRCLNLSNFRNKEHKLDADFNSSKLMEKSESSPTEQSRHYPNALTNLVAVKPLSSSQNIR